MDALNSTTDQEVGGSNPSESAPVQAQHTCGTSAPRRGFPPTDGPDTYKAGTLFPCSSKKVACAINVANSNRPLVVLANLSGGGGRLRQRCR
jgi:acetyl-CoA carboxylase carboxyltransferase component